MGVSCGTGGFFTGLCLDKPEAQEYTGAFLKALAARYKGHPALLGYDVANECYKPAAICHCEETLGGYRAWLRGKYGDIQTLNTAWKTYSYTDFEQITPPPRPAFFADSACWLEFRRERHQAHIRWKANILRGVDPAALITAHGMAATFSSRSDCCCDDWAAADMVETYGATWVQSRKGSQPWKQLSAFDLTRAASRGKPFWHTEAQGGPLWLQPGLEGRPREDGRVTSAEDIRIWNLMSMACGAKGILYTRFRPLLDGPLFGAFAPYGDDGGATPRSAMAATVAHWAAAPEQAALMQAKPAPGDIGILFVPECETASYLLTSYGNRHLYPEAMWGAWRGFKAAGVQADYVHIDDIEATGIPLYLPMPISLSPRHAKALTRWVQAGGTLICEGAPGYFDDALHVDLDGAQALLREVFGVRQAGVEFAPDLAAQAAARVLGQSLPCGGCLQTYTPIDAEVVGMLGEAAIAARRRCGAGRALLLGTSPGIGCMEHEDNLPAAAFEALFASASKTPYLQISDKEVVARIHRGAYSYLWLLNPTHHPREVRLAAPFSIVPGRVLWAGGRLLQREAKAITAALGACDGMVLELKRSESPTTS
jgi:beta-galactosidase